MGSQDRGIVRQGLEAFIPRIYRRPSIQTRKASRKKFDELYKTSQRPTGLKTIDLPNRRLQSLSINSYQAPTRHSIHITLMRWIENIHNSQTIIPYLGKNSGRT